MGGNVAWTLRLPDGIEHRMQRWTNVFGGIDGVTSTDAFLKGEPEAIQQSLKSWLSMKADWEANSGSGKYREHMTSVYAPYPYGLRPSEYGFFVTDFRNYTIISCQTYTRLLRFQIYGRYLNPESLTPNDTDTYGDPLSEKYAILQELHRQGRIETFENEDYEDQSTKGLSLPEIINLAMKEHQSHHRNSKIIGYVGIKPVEPWRILDFEAFSEDGRRAAFSAVKNLGFGLSEAEEKDFEQWIKGDDDDA
jgi:hypothetical protein